MRNHVAFDAETIQAALAGYRHTKEQIESKIAEIQRRIGGGGAGPRPKTAAPADGAPRKRRKMSAGARKRIAAAQRKRWAAFRKAKGQ